MTAVTLSHPRVAILSWVPFALAVAVHLGSKALGWGEVDHATKPLLMVTLAIPIIVFGRRDRPLPFALLLGGVLLSWIGDVTLDSFVIGLSFFLLAHIAYTVMFFTTFRRRVSWWSLLYVAWFVVFLTVLWSSLGALLVPVAVYGLALALMASSATRGNLLTTLGGAFFVLSDSLLALRMFTPQMQGTAADILIMVCYLAAQTLLVLGMLRRR